MHKAFNLASDITHYIIHAMEYEKWNGSKVGSWLLERIGDASLKYKDGWYLRLISYSRPLYNAFLSEKHTFRMTCDDVTRCEKNLWKAYQQNLWIYEKKKDRNT